LLSNTFYVEAGGKNPVIETPLSAAASIMELLIQSWGGKIRVFPAVPDQWKEAAFHHLMAQGGFLVSASRSCGKTDWVTIKSLSGEPCVVKVPGWANAVQSGKGKKILVTRIAEGEFLLDLKTGVEMTIVPFGSENTRIFFQPVPHSPGELNLYGVKKGKQLPNDQSWPVPEFRIGK